MAGIGLAMLEAMLNAMPLCALAAERGTSPAWDSAAARENRGGRMRCEVVAIGTELLLGIIVDTNSTWIGEQLALAGHRLPFPSQGGRQLRAHRGFDPPSARAQ